MEEILEKLRKTIPGEPKKWNFCVETTEKIIKRKEKCVDLQIQYNFNHQIYDKIKKIEMKQHLDKSIKTIQEANAEKKKEVLRFKQKLNSIHPEIEILEKKINETKEKKEEIESENEKLTSEFQGYQFKIESYNNVIKSFENQIYNLADETNSIYKLNSIYDNIFKIINHLNPPKKVHFRAYSESASPFQKEKSSDSPSSIHHKVEKKSKRSRSCYGDSSSQNLFKQNFNNFHSTSEILEMHLSITALAISYGGGIFAAGSEDCIVSIYLMGRCLPSQTIKMEKSIISVRFSFDDRFLLVASFDSIIIFEYQGSCFVPKSYKIKLDSIKNADFVSNEYFVVCTGDKSIKVYKMEKNMPKYRGSLNSKHFVNCVCGSPFSQEFLAGYANGEIGYWGCNNSQPISEHQVCNNQILHITSNENNFFALSLSGRLSVISMAKYDVLRTINLKNCCLHDRSKIAVFGDSVLLGTDEGSIKEFSINDGKLISTWQQDSKAAITSLCANGSTIITGGKNGDIKFWDCKH